MKYSIDRIIENIAILENIKTGIKIEVPIHKFLNSIHEGAIVIYKNKKYYLDDSEEEKRRQQILEKFQKLKKSD